jgi:hypothetical protein
MLPLLPFLLVSCRMTAIGSRQLRSSLCQNVNVS